VNFTMIAFYSASYPVKSSRALVELVRVYSKSDSWKRSEPLIVRLSHLLDATKDSVNETVLITAGALGKYVKSRSS
jgi:hypothetical protein